MRKLLFCGKILGNYNFGGSDRSWESETLEPSVRNFSSSFLPIVSGYS